MRHERRMIRTSQPPQDHAWLCYCIGCHWQSVGDHNLVRGKWLQHLEVMKALGEVR